MVSYFGKNGPLIVAVMWTETLFALAIVLARLYTRHRLIRSVGWDDHLIAISTIEKVLFIGYTTLCTVAAFNGFGSHLEDLGLSQAVIAIKWEIAAQTFNIAAIGTSKSSVAVFLLRIINRKLHFWMLWFAVGSTAFVCASCIVFMFTQCTPLESVFNPSLPHTCYLNFTANAIFSGSYTTSMDFALAIFPWFILWKLNMKRKERLTIAIGLSLGVIAGVCGIVRAIDLQAIAGKSDYTFLTLPLMLWGSTEMMLCLVCASVPILRPLYKEIRGINSSAAVYELGNTPSKQLETGRTKEHGSHTRSKSTRGDDKRNMGILSGNREGQGFNTTAFHNNSSDEEILKGMQGRFGDAELGHGDFDPATGYTKKSIHKTTVVDITYQ